MPWNLCTIKIDLAIPAYCPPSQYVRQFRYLRSVGLARVTVGIGWSARLWAGSAPRTLSGQCGRPEGSINGRQGGRHLHSAVNAIIGIGSWNHSLGLNYPVASLVKALHARRPNIRARFASPTAHRYRLTMIKAKFVSGIGRAERVPESPRECLTRGPCAIDNSCLATIRLPSTPTKPWFAPCYSTRPQKYPHTRVSHLDPQA